MQFKERNDVPVYQKDVRVFDVMEADGKIVGMYMMDMYVRESKRGGAWMSSMRKQQRMDGTDILPIIYNVFNFPAPVGDAPALLTF